MLLDLLPFGEINTDTHRYFLKVIQDVKEKTYLTARWVNDCMHGNDVGPEVRGGIHNLGYGYDQKRTYLG